MSVAPVIHIGGWPGAGKQTIGCALATLIHGRLIHNHIFLDAAQAVFERGTDECKKLREDVRAVVLRAAAMLPREVPIIFTDALSTLEADRKLFEPTRVFAKERGARLCPVVLEIDTEANLTRLTDPARKGAKLTDPDILLDLRARFDLLEPDGALRLDATGLSPQEAAVSIAAEFGLSHG